VLNCCVAMRFVEVHDSRSQLTFGYSAQTVATLLALAGVLLVLQSLQSGSFDCAGEPFCRIIVPAPSRRCLVIDAAALRSRQSHSDSCFALHLTGTDKDRSVCIFCGAGRFLGWCLLIVPTVLVFAGEHICHRAT
jgi:hypothetical protein